MAPLQSKSTSKKMDHWFYYQEGSIHGPVDLENLLLLNQQNQASPILTSKSGLKKWYKISDVERLLQIDQKYKLEIAEEKKKLTDLLDEKITTLQSLGGANHASSDKSAAGAVELARMEELEGGEVKAAAFCLEKSLAQATLTGKFLAKKSPPKEHCENVSRTKDKYNIDDIRHIGDNYHFLRGQHRLGSRANPLVSGLILYPLTLSLFWYFWIKRSILELVWHLTSEFDCKENKLPAALALIPGVHLWFVYFIAKTIKKVEKQNGYQKISMGLALLLGLLPPLAIIYLQRSMNQHWLAHVNDHRRKALRKSPGSTPPEARH